MPSKFSVKSNFKDVITDINNFKVTTEVRVFNVLNEIGKYATQQMQSYFNSAEYAGYNDVKCSYDFTMGTKWKRVHIYANGKATLFIEFGTGVHFNHPRNYGGKVPKGVCKIGTYGLGLGSEHLWRYRYNGMNQGNGWLEDNGKWVDTMGNKPNECVWKTIQDLQKYIPTLISQMGETL